MSASPKRDQVADKTTSRRVTIRDVAAATGCSKSLVAMALRGDHGVASATRKRINQVANKLGYETNPLVARLMAQLRQSRQNVFQANLALVNCSPEDTIFQWHTFRDFRLGVQSGARKLGYGMDEFWLHKPGLDFGRLARILRMRQVAGIVFVAAMGSDIFHDTYDTLWRHYPSVAVGVAKTDPQIACVCADHFQTSKDAVAEVLKRGYARPGFAVGADLDRLVDSRFSGGFLTAVQHLPASKRLPVHFADFRNADPFWVWFRRHRPDCVLALHGGVFEWLKAKKLSMPGPVGVAHLDWNDDMPGYAGMVQGSRTVGHRAAELVIQHFHANQKGALSDPSITLVESRWRDGPSLPGI